MRVFARIIFLSSRSHNLSRLVWTLRIILGISLFFWNTENLEWHNIEKLFIQFEFVIAAISLAQQSYKCKKRKLPEGSRLFYLFPILWTFIIER